MKIKSKLKTFFFLDDEYDENNEEIYEKAEPLRPQKQPAKVQNVVSLQSVQKSSSSKVILVEAKSYAEAQDITDDLKNKRAVVVNLQRLSYEEGRQIVDF